MCFDWLIVTHINTPFLNKTEVYTSGSLGVLEIAHVTLIFDFFSGKLFIVIKPELMGKVSFVNRFSRSREFNIKYMAPIEIYA